MKSGKNINYKDIFIKALIFLVTVVLIVYFLPRDSKFNYQFEVDRPWKYGQLMATFDFPIYKDEATIKKEQDSIMRAFQPYFNLNTDVERDAIERLRNDYNTTLRNVFPSADYVRYVERALRDVYKSGVVSLEDIDMLRKDSVESILVVESRQANPRFTDGIFTIKEAYEYILNANPDQYQPEILRQGSLNNYIDPNLIYDAERTEIVKEDILNNYTWATGMVQSGQKIVDRGEIVTPATYQILESLRKESLKRSDSKLQDQMTLGGQFLYVSLIIVCFMLYLQLFRKFYYHRMRSITLLFTLIVIFCVITSLLVAGNLVNVYVIPYAMLPIIIRVFLDSRTAFLAHICTILICSTTVGAPYEFVLLQLPAGLAAIYSLRELSQRSQLFRTAFLVFLTYVIVFFSYELIIENDWAKLSRTEYIYFVINGILLLFAYPLLFMFEKLFGFTSNVTLVELSNVNNPLLRRMSETAPGTFQHSMQVANLASEAAMEIGAKAQLVRTGAMYHDIGKMENPAFFTENQSGGINPHKSLTYEQSAQIVINHVKDGLRLADKNRLPQAIKDFISTHHGRGKTKYFYISWKNENPGEEPDEELFTYPGPNPFSKETAILMMADSVEAASRSLPEYTEESISVLVDKIIDSQMEEGFFRHCPITFQDIETVKRVFKDKLMTTYHTRISYPEINKKNEEIKKPEDKLPPNRSENAPLLSTDEGIVSEALDES